MDAATQPTQGTAAWQDALLAARPMLQAHRADGIVLVRSIVALGEGVPDVTLAAANLLTEHGCATTADELLAAGLQKFADHEGLLAALAAALLRRGDLPAALEQWQALRRRAPHRPAVLLGVAVTLRALHRFHEAEQVIGTALAWGGNEDPGLLAAHAENAVSLQAWDEIRPRFAALLARVPHAPAGYDRYAATLHAMGRPDEARAVLAAAPSERAAPAAATTPAPAEPAAPAAGATTAANVESQAETPAAGPWAYEQLQEYGDAVLPLWQAGRISELEALLAEGITRWPRDLGLVAWHARAAVRRDDWPVAAERWAQVRAIDENAPEQFEAGVRALLLAGRLAEAEALAERAQERFAGSAPLALLYVELAQRRGEPAEALRRIDLARLRFPDDVMISLRHAEMLVRMERPQQADVVLRQAVAAMPEQWDIALAYAESAARLNEWSQARERYAALRERFPQNIDGWLDSAIVLFDMGLEAETEALLAEGMLRHPDSAALAVEHAVLPARCGTSRDVLGLTLERLAEVGARFPADEGVWLARIEYLGLDQQAAELALVLRAARAALPDSLAIALAEARHTTETQGPAAALDQLAAIQAAHPDAEDGYIAHAEALGHAGRHDAALAAVRAAEQRFGVSVPVIIAAARLTTAQGNWDAALASLEQALRGNPTDIRLTTELFEMKLRAVGAGAEIVHTEERRETAATSIYDIMMRFESMGGEVQGCEFGLVQRTLGAEPLGLLRWTEVHTENLIAALAARFEGIGDPAQTDLLIDDNPNFGEYIIEDTRLHLRVDTFTKPADVPFDAMYKQSCRRLKFLGRKLLADIAEAEKIFVYKYTVRNLTDDEVDRLFAAVRTIGPATLMCVRYADAAHPFPSVEVRQPGLLIAYIDRFHTGRDGESVGAAYMSWQALCEQAHTLWLASRSPPLPGQSDAPADLAASATA